MRKDSKRKQPISQGQTPSTAEVILECAADLFAEKGFAATSMREISESANVTKPTLYYHFDNKEGLMRAIVNLANGFLIESLNPAKGKSVREVLIQTATSILTSVETHPALFRLMCRLQHDIPKSLKAELEEHREQSLSLIGGFFRSGTESNELRGGDSNLLASLFFGGLLACAEKRLRGEAHGTESAEQLSQTFVELFLDGAAPKKEPK